MISDTAEISVIIWNVFKQVPQTFHHWSDKKDSPAPKLTPLADQTFLKLWDSWMYFTIKKAQISLLQVLLLQ